MIFEDILRVTYFLLPVALANMAPVLVRKIFPYLNYPLDFYKKSNGERILGDHKTFRGLLFGILGGMIGALLLKHWYTYNFILWSLSIVKYDSINIYLYGFLLGFGVITGDAFGSFIKRRLGKKPGESFLPLDQIVAPLGAMIFISPLYLISLRYFLIALLISFFFHILIKWIGYLLKIEDKKF